MQPGVYRNIPNEDYHHGPGDSKSGLDLLRKSPIALHAAKTGAIDRKPTPAQALGTALHALVLEPDSFATEYALPFDPPVGALATVDDIKAALTDAEIEFKKSAKKGDLETIIRVELPDAVLLTDAREAYEQANAGRQILAPADWVRLHSMRDAVMAHPAARKLLAAPGEAELSAYWNEPVVSPKYGEITGEILLRCRPDFWRRDGIIVDLKSCSPGGAAPEEFARSLNGWRYYVQHAMYLRGAAAALNAAQVAGRGFEGFSTPRAFVFIAVENDACVVDGVAKGVAVYQLQPDSVALGLQEFREDVFTLAQCQASGQWPGYSTRIEAIELPPYAFTQAAARQVTA